jgi:putative aldouronate transport system substrate-binding protein
MKKTLAVVAALSLSLAAGCSASSDAADGQAGTGFRTTGLPIVTQPITLTFTGSKAPLADLPAMSLVKQWQKDTNVAIRWQNLPLDAYKEKKNLILASGDLPDAFYNSELSDSDIMTYGSNGTLIPLEGLIDKYAPNLKKVFERRPALKAAVTAADGHIYALPSAEELDLGSVPFFWSINTTWLKKLGLSMPQTIEQYHDVLTAFHTKDPNGNGKADEIPLSFMNNWWCADVGDLFAALSGMPDNVDHRIVRDDKVIYTAIQPEYRDAIAKLHQWYSEGLIDPESFTQNDKQYLAKGKTNPEVLGSYVWWETEEVVGPDRTKDYALMGPLQGPAGKLVGRSNNVDYSRNAFAITRADKYPEATMRWVDRLYDPVMSAQVAWGPIGEGLQKDSSGVLVATPLKAGEDAGERRQKIAPNGPHVVLKEDFQSVVAPEPRAAQRAKDLQQIYLPYAEKQSYPLVFFTQDELARIGQIGTDVKAIVDEKRAAWIVRGGIEQDWDGYVASLKQAGIDELVSIYQAAYDRNKKNSR